MISQMTDRIDNPKVILLLKLAASRECEPQQRDADSKVKRSFQTIQHAFE